MGGGTRARRTSTRGGVIALENAARAAFALGRVGEAAALYEQVVRRAFAAALRVETDAAERAKIERLLAGL